MQLLIAHFRFEPKYLNVLFGLVIAASLLNNICFIALKVVRVHEQNLWREGNFDINEVQSQEPAAVSSNMAL